MRVPDSLTTLFEQGALDDVLRPLMSGKEAQVFLVVSGGKQAVAKVYKEAIHRSFKHRAAYTEGRKVRNSRDQRAIDKRSKHGREQDEAAWRSTEVDMIHRLHAAGVRVPVPSHFIDGVLVMELIVDADGNPAPRLGDVACSPELATAIYERLIREVVKMLCAGVVHGDLSEFNVLLGADGPVIIDFPQSIDSAANTNARALLVRDVDNLHRFLSRSVPSARRIAYAEEMWRLYEQNLLTPDTRLRGDYRAPQRLANTASVQDLIDDANRDERKRRDALGLRGGPEEPPARPQPKVDTGNGGFKRGGPPPPVYQGKPNGGLSVRGKRGKPPPGSGQPRPAGQSAGNRGNQTPQAPRGNQAPQPPRGNQTPQAPRGNQAPQPPRGNQPQTNTPARPTPATEIREPASGAPRKKRHVKRRVATTERGGR
jgi:RIO kinase 1